MAETTSSITSTYSARGVVMATTITILLSIAANLVVRAAGMAVIDVPDDFLPLATIGPVILFTTLFISTAGMVFWIITRQAKNPLRAWTITAWIALFFTFLPDLGLLVNPGAIPVGTSSPGAVLILIVMHLVSFAIVMLVLPRFAARS